MLAPRENAIFSNPCCRKKKTKQNKYLPLIIQEEERFFILNQPPFTICFIKKKRKRKEKRRGYVFHPLAPPHPLPDGKTFLKVDRWQRELHSIDSGRWFEFVPD